MFPDASQLICIPGISKDFNLIGSLLCQFHLVNTGGIQRLGSHKGGGAVCVCVCACVCDVVGMWGGPGETAGINKRHVHFQNISYYTRGSQDGV